MKSRPDSGHPLPVQSTRTVQTLDTYPSKAGQYRARLSTHGGDLHKVNENSIKLACYLQGAAFQAPQEFHGCALRALEPESELSREFLKA